MRRVASYNIRFYDTNPGSILPNSGSFTWTGPADAVGKAIVDDPETGIEGVTLDDDNNGRESARAFVDLNGTTSTISNVDAEIVWTVQDSVTGEIFQVAAFDVENGAAAGDYTISEIPLVPGRSYTVLERDTNPDVTAGDIAFSALDYVAPEDIVTGTGGADTIDASYSGDAQNDQVDDGFGTGPDGMGDEIDAGGGHDVVNAGLGDDTVHGGTGRDTIDGGSGDDSLFGDGGADSILGGTGNDSIDGGGGADTIDAGRGNDSVDGGAGNDVIDGGGGSDTLSGGDGNDTITGDSAGPPTGHDEYLDWSQAGPAGTNIAGGFTQNTGDIDVTVSFSDDGNNNPTFLIEDDDTYVDSDPDFDPNSSLYLYGDGDGATSTATIDFAAADGAATTGEVEDVSFWINDIDYYAGNHQDVITINAWDADGNPITVTLTPYGNDDATGDTITGMRTLDDPDDARGAVLVQIAGPVARIEMVYSNALTGTQAIHVSDIHFTSIPDPDVGGADSIDGGAGDDVIDGAFGDDTLTGGSGDDTLTGGAGDDTFVMADGGGADVITDFDAGDDDGDGTFNDQLDLSGLTDADGNPVDAWDIVISDDGNGNAVLTFPNGETITLTGVSPASLNGAQWLNAAGVPCFTAGTLIATPRGEVPAERLRPGDSVLTLDRGAQPVRWTGRRELGPRHLLANPGHRPVLIPAGTLGNHAPLLVSPLHGMLMGPRAGVSDACLVRARHLAEAPGPVRIAAGKRRVTYVHLMLDRHEILFANGAPTESFYPGPQALAMYAPADVADLAALVPGLLEQPVAQCYGPTVRPFLKRREVLGRIRLHAGSPAPCAA